MIAFTYTKLSGFGWTFVRIVTVSVWMIRRRKQKCNGRRSVILIFNWNIVWTAAQSFIENIETTKRISYEISAKLLSKNHFNYRKIASSNSPSSTRKKVKHFIVNINRHSHKMDTKTKPIYSDESVYFGWYWTEVSISVRSCFISVVVKSQKPLNLLTLVLFFISSDTAIRENNMFTIFSVCSQVIELCWLNCHKTLRRYSFHNKYFSI